MLMYSASSLLRDQSSDSVLVLLYIHNILYLLPQYYAVPLCWSLGDVILLLLVMPRSVGNI